MQQGWILCKHHLWRKMQRSGETLWARPWRTQVPGPWIPLGFLSSVKKGTVESTAKPEPKSGIWSFSYEAVKGKPPVFWVLICWEDLFDRRNDKTSFLETFQGRPAKYFIAEIKNFLTTGDAKLCPLFIKPLKVWLHFSWMGFYPGGTAASAGQAGAQPTAFCLPLVMAPGRFKGMISGNGPSGGPLVHVPFEKDVQEWSPGVGAAWALLLFSHPAPETVISPQIATLAVCRTGVMEDCDACESGNQSSLRSTLMQTAQLHQRLCCDVLVQEAQAIFCSPLLKT